MYFILMARCSMDDLPLGIYSTLDSAKTAAAEVTDEDLDQARDAMLAGESEFIRMAILEFRGGKPHTIRALD